MDNTTECIKCYDCKTLTVAYKPNQEGQQVCRCSKCGTSYEIRVYQGRRLVILGKLA